MLGLLALVVAEVEMLCSFSRVCSTVDLSYRKFRRPIGDKTANCAGSTLKHIGRTVQRQMHSGYTTSRVRLLAPGAP